MKTLSAGKRWLCLLLVLLAAALLPTAAFAESGEAGEYGPAELSRKLTEFCKSFTGLKRQELVDRGLELVDSDWCASFIGRCAQAAGLGDIIPYDPAQPYSRQIYTDVLAAGGSPVTEPQYGDLVFFDFDEGGTFDSRDIWTMDHVGIVCQVNAEKDTIYIVHGNAHIAEGGYTVSDVCAPAGDYGKCLYCRGYKYSIESDMIAGYLRPNWEAARDKSGWISLGGSLYYRAARDGQAVMGAWVTEGGKRYYLDSLDGRRVTGAFVTVDGADYYLSARDGHAMKGGFITVDGMQYYLSAGDGHVVKGSFVTVDGADYYLSPRDGHVMKNSRIVVSGVEYYLDAKGVAQKAPRRPV